MCSIVENIIQNLTNEDKHPKDILKKIEVLYPKMYNTDKKETMYAVMKIMGDKIYQETCILFMEKWELYGYPILCDGCIYDMNNQLGHIGIDGCVE